MERTRGAGDGNPAAATRLGVFGGSFNPVHHGHLFLAQLAREAAGLDHVLFVPAARPPHKQGEDLAPAIHREAMLELALQDEPAASVSRVELQPGGPRYTVETMSRLREQFPEAKLHFIMGMDSLRDLPTWRDPERLLREFRVIAVDRPGLEPATLDPEVASRCRLVLGNPFGISGTAIRKRAAAGLSVRHLVPSQVAAYIRDHALYREPV